MSKKDVQERNHLVKWGVIIGIAFFTLLATIISFIDFEILRNRQIVRDEHIRLFLFALAIFATAIVVNKFIKYLARYLNHIYLKRFKWIQELGVYQESKTRSHFSKPLYDHVVLLLHGFTASPQEFRFLTPYLEQNGINYVAPIIFGFGIDNTVILNKARREDWYRSALQQYDELSKIAKKVSIVGHSMGGIIATYIAQNRPVHKLILSGPGVYSVDCDLKYKKILMMPIISSLYIKLIPYLPKPIRKGRKTTSDTLDNTYTSEIFQYLAVPIRSVKEIFKAQDDIKLEKISCQELIVLYGKHELTVDMNKLFNALDAKKIKYQKYCFENSAHNVLEDYDREKACEIVVSKLHSSENVLQFANNY